MSKNSSLTIENEKFLKQLLPIYYDNKTEMDSFKKEVDTQNKDIKAILLKAGLDKYQVEDIIAKVTVSKREDFVEETLIEILKKLKVKDVVKKKEYVDFDMLEKLIYEGTIDAEKLASARTVKEVVTLKVSKIKGGN
jgi:hypothetical protein